MCMCTYAQSCPALGNFMDCSPPGSSVHGIFQARILKQFAMFYSKGSSLPKGTTHISCVSCIGRQTTILHHLGSHIHLCIYTYIHILFHILFHSRLLQDVEYSWLCYTVGPCCSSILYLIIVVQ